ncbi:MAG TPA: sterol desaturase family protein [Candidatus Sericytochromatia bacterium]
MEVFNAALVTLLLLVLGDCISTFLYHVPEHTFGKFHTLVHHSKNRNFIHYAVLTKNPLVLVDGLLGVLPYFIFVPWFWTLSPVGTVLGLVLGECHVVWRHTSILDYRTPDLIRRICNFLCITTPERHWLHHQNAKVAYGDIFTFYDQPARAWLRFLLLLKRKLRKAKAKGLNRRSDLMS